MQPKGLLRTCPVSLSASSELPRGGARRIGGPRASTHQAFRGDGPDVGGARAPEPHPNLANSDTGRAPRCRGPSCPSFASTALLAPAHRRRRLRAVGRARRPFFLDFDWPRCSDYRWLKSTDANNALPIPDALWLLFCISVRMLSSEAPVPLARLFNGAPRSGPHPKPAERRAVGKPRHRPG